MPSLCDRLVAFVVALGLLVAAGLPASAQGESRSYEGALAGFLSDSFGDTTRAVGSVATSGDPLAENIIRALQDGRLAVSAEAKKVYIRETGGAVIDAASGQPAANPPS